MHSKSYDINAPKKNKNLSLNSDLLDKVEKKLKINLSQKVEAMLEDELRKVEALEWERKNQKYIKDYNAYVEKHGTSSQRWKKILGE